MPDRAAKRSRGALSGVEVVIGSEYLKSKRDALTQLIKGAGGKVVKHPRQQTQFLVQGHNDEECDERLETCCSLGILGCVLPPRDTRTFLHTTPFIPLPKNLQHVFHQRASRLR